MGRGLTTGPEVKRVESAGGVMLYDASRAGNLTHEWFDPAYWRARDAIEGEARGRGTAWYVRADDRPLVLRHYRRGGLIARLSHDRYLWTGEESSRPFAEWHLTYHLARAGLPVANPIGARYQRNGRTYRGDLLTARLVDTLSLAASLEMDGLPLITWVAVGRCVRRFHDFGVCHADLNAQNILLGTREAVHLIDFDRASLREPGLWRDGNLVRLRRSLDKVTEGLPAGRFSDADWHSLLAGYREAPPAVPADS